MPNLKAVVVGAGGISGAWFPPLKAEGIEVAGIVDLDPERAQAQALKYGLTCEVSTNMRRTLHRVRPDFVVDLTVPEAHGRGTCTALRAGFPVIGEKPMASSMRDARRMVQASEEADRIYMVSQSRRYVPRHVALQQFLRVDFHLLRELVRRGRPYLVERRLALPGREGRRGLRTRPGSAGGGSYWNHRIQPGETDL
jgi:predicted dehydrogenase